MASRSATAATTAKAKKQHMAEALEMENARSASGRYMTEHVMSFARRPPYGYPWVINKKH